MASLKLINQPSNLDRNYATLSPQHELTQAKEEAASRHKDIASGLLSELRYWLGFLDDLLSCEIRNWNVCLCEYVMSEVIVGTVLYNWDRSIEALEESSVGSMKMSEELKAKAEIRTSVTFITHFLGMVEYVSLQVSFPERGFIVRPLKSITILCSLCLVSIGENGSSGIIVREIPCSMVPA